MGFWDVFKDKPKKKKRRSSSVKITNPKMKHLGGKCILCGKKIPKSSFMCARCGKYDRAHTRYMEGKTNKKPVW